MSLVCVGSACSVWTTLGLLQLKAVCASWVYTAQAPGCSAGYCPKWALHFVDFPGLSCSGSGSRVFCKGTHSGGYAFCALPGSEQLRQPGVWQAHCPMWAMRLNHLPSLATRFPWVPSKFPGHPKTFASGPLSKFELQPEGGQKDDMLKKGGGTL